MTASVQFNEFFNIISNERRSAQETCSGVDPSTGTPLWPTPVATEQDFEEAVECAGRAFKEWSAKDHAERIFLLKAFANALESNTEGLTELMHKETGKTWEFAKSEVVLGINTIRRHVEWSVPDEVQKDDQDVKIVIQHAPIGVIGGIVPWNFPFQLAIIKIAPALLVGCTMILKPSPYTPYTALKIGEIAAQIFPPGVLQVLSGNDSLGPWMTLHPGIGKVSFTGSIATGKRVMAAAATTLKRVNLELGGNDAAVVTEDFDMAKAAAMVAATAFAHSGQICIATKRVYVHDAVYDEFMAHFTAIVRGYQPGEGFCSPIQNQMQYERVQAIYRDCEANGYDFAVGGSGSGSAAWDDTQPGYFIRPAVIANPPDHSRVVQEEAFGPIVPVLRCRDDDDAVARANDTATGLGATVFCRDKGRAWALAGRLATGNVWVNSGLKMDPVALFGAHKQSGIGGALGPLGLKSFTETRTVTYWKDNTPPPAADKVSGFFG